MSTIAVFPGQGAQTPGMGKQLHDTFSAARDVFEMVDDALGEKLTALIFNGSAEQLTRTENAQPALMACSLAAIRALEAEAGRPIETIASLVAGHSLGEYSALAAARALDIADAARLLRLRGAAMQRAVPIGDGAMAAIIGLSAVKIDELLKALSGGVAVLANDNSDGQAVLSGDRASIAAAATAAKAAGAKRALMLDVSVPFHCPLMQPAAAELKPALEAIDWRRPVFPIIANVTAEIHDDPGCIADLLTKQVTARVRWRESMAAMAAHGVDRMIEFGAGKVLTGLARRTLKGTTLVNIATPQDVGAFVEGLA